MTGSDNYQIAKQRFVIALDGMTSQDFLRFVDQLTEDSIDRLVDSLGEKAGALLKDDLTALRSGKIVVSTRQDFEVVVPSHSVDFKIGSGMDSVQTDGTPGYKGVESPMKKTRDPE